MIDFIDVLIVVISPFFVIHGLVLIVDFFKGQ